MYIIIGFFFETLKGIISTIFGAFIIKNLFAMMNNYNDPDKMRDEVNYWCGIMFGCALLAFVCVFSAKYLFGVVGENITINIRQDLYKDIMRKHMGWHDDP